MYVYVVDDVGVLFPHFSVVHSFAPTVVYLPVVRTQSSVAGRCPMPSTTYLSIVANDVPGTGACFFISLYRALTCAGILQGFSEQQGVADLRLILAHLALMNYDNFGEYIENALRLTMTMQHEPDCFIRNTALEVLFHQWLATVGPEGPDDGFMRDINVKYANILMDPAHRMKYVSDIDVTMMTRYMFFYNNIIIVPVQNNDDLDEHVLGADKLEVINRTLWTAMGEGVAGGDAVVIVLLSNDKHYNWTTFEVIHRGSSLMQSAMQLHAFTALTSVVDSLTVVKKPSSVEANKPHTCSSFESFTAALADVVSSAMDSSSSIVTDVRSFRSPFSSCGPGVSHRHRPASAAASAPLPLGDTSQGAHAPPAITPFPVNAAHGTHAAHAEHGTPAEHAEYAAQQRPVPHAHTQGPVHAIYHDNAGLAQQIALRQKQELEEEQERRKREEMLARNADLALALQLADNDEDDRLAEEEQIARNAALARRLSDQEIQASTSLSSSSRNSDRNSPNAELAWSIAEPEVRLLANSEIAQRLAREEELERNADLARRISTEESNAEMAKKLAEEENAAFAIAIAEQQNRGVDDASHRANMMHILMKGAGTGGKSRIQRQRHLHEEKEEKEERGRGQGRGRDGRSNRNSSRSSRRQSGNGQSVRRGRRHN